QYQEEYSKLEAEVKLKAKTGDADLEARLDAFAKAHSDRTSSAQIRLWRDQMKAARTEAAYTAACALTGAEKIDALQMYLANFPDSKHQQDALAMLTDLKKSAKATTWKADWDAFDKELGNLVAEEIDKRRQMVADYLAKIKADAGNPYVKMAETKAQQIEDDAAARFKQANDAAETALKYNQFQQAVEAMTQYKTRFHDATFAPKADEKVREIDTKAFAFWTDTKKRALVKLKAEVDSKSARNEVTDTIEKLKGIGTMADDAKLYSENLKTWDKLHTMASDKNVIPNVQNRTMPEVLCVQGKTGLSIIELDAKKIKLVEGGTPVTWMKSWVDLSLEERLVVYTYLLQPDGEDMPKETQALLDKARETMK
ncbi:MAG TPA: hypothetical protein VL860_10630, partial [Planctomycetota bacterium]|nr:hypothetical protein [Planctomycetota bacterium]